MNVGHRPNANVIQRKLIDKIIYVIAALGPLSSIPQIMEIWVVDKSAAGVSLSTWLLFFLMAIAWLWYGVAHKDKPLIVSNALWILSDAVVIAGAFYYDHDLL